MPCNEAPWSDVSAYVLAGGRSARMGADKAFVHVDGVELIERAVHTLQACCERVAILSGPPNFRREALLNRYARVVPDHAAGHNGPLAGLLAALMDAQTPFVVLLAVDQPGVSPAALELLRTAVQAPEAAAACFTGPHGPEPLPLAVRRDLLPQLTEAAATGERRLLDTVGNAALKIGRKVSTIEALQSPAGTLRLVNLNTPADLQTWHEEAGRSNQSARRASHEAYGS